MRKWDEIQIVLLNGNEMSFLNSFFKMRTEDMFCIENDLGEGNCIPVDNITSVSLKANAPSGEKSSFEKRESPVIEKKKRGFLSRLGIS